MDKGTTVLNGADAQPPRSSKEKISDAKEKVAVADASKVPRGAMKGLVPKRRGSGGGSNSNGGGSGNNSDNSGILSLGNNSFGFNFDNEEAMLSGSPQNSETDAKTGESDSDGNAGSGRKVSVDASPAKVGTSTRGPLRGPGKSVTPSPAAAPMPNPVSKPLCNPARADTNLRPAPAADLNKQEESAPYQLSGTKRRTRENADSDNDSGGYNSDEDEAKASRTRNTAQDSVPDSAPSSQAKNSAAGSATKGSAPKGKGKKGKYLDEQKREERNAREKERSFRISRQINELRNLLSSGGVIVPKGTKSSVLTEAANYIRMLQQHQYKSEIDRHQLIQQVQMIGGGALGPQAAKAVRHVAAQNGVWSLGNFGGVPPKSAMSFYQQETTSGDGDEPGNPEEPQQESDTLLVTSVAEHEYRFVFNSCSVGMAIASMGGAFIDCNELFCSLSGYSKQEVCAMTIFNLTSRQDLQNAFDLISQMISPPSDGRVQGGPRACALRGSMKDRDDLGLSVSLIKGDDGIAKCFCITLVQSPASPFDSSRPTPATAALVKTEAAPVAQTQAAKPSGSGTFNGSPAYTAG